MGCTPTLGSKKMNFNLILYPMKTLLSLFFCLLLLGCKNDVKKDASENEPTPDAQESVVKKVEEEFVMQSTDQH